MPGGGDRRRDSAQQRSRRPSIHRGQARPRHCRSGRLIVTTAADASTLPTLVVHLQREKAKALVRAGFPRRRWRIISTRSAEELDGIFRRVLVDASLIDMGSPDEDTWKAAGFAAEFPSAPYFAILPLRPS